MKILLVDDHVLFREGLSSLLQQQGDMQVVGEVVSSNDAVAKVIELNPNIMLIDISPRIIDGLNIIRTVTEHYPDIKIVLISNLDSDEMLINALRCGAKGVMFKNSSIDIVLEAIRTVHNGEAVVSKRMTFLVLKEFARQGAFNQLYRNPLEKLTVRELEVFDHLASGASNHQISERLTISANTVKIHVHNILEKLKLHNRTEVSRYAHLFGLTHSTNETRHESPETKNSLSPESSQDEL